MKKVLILVSAIVATPVFAQPAQQPQSPPPDASVLSQLLGEANNRFASCVSQAAASNKSLQDQLAAALKENEELKKPAAGKD